ERWAVGHPGGSRRRAALRGRLQLGLLRPLSRQNRSGLGGWGRHARRSQRRAARRGGAGGGVWQGGSPAGSRCAGISRGRERGGGEGRGGGQGGGGGGKWVNEEAFGRPNDLPWKLYISPEHRPMGYAQYEFFHPTFLYESIWDFVVFLMLVGWLRPRLRGRPGALFFAYIGLYSVGRFAIEALRLDSFWLGSLRVPQLASVVGMLVAVIGMAWTNYRSASPVTG